MLSVIKQLRQSFAPAVESARCTDLQLAAAVLLLEVSVADFESQPEEKTAVLHALERAFALNDDQVAILYENAMTSSVSAISLYDFIAVINRECDQQEKKNLLTQLWRVAFADGRIDKYEDHRIRKIAELLYMPHRAFIQARHEAEAER